MATVAKLDVVIDAVISPLMAKMNKVQRAVNDALGPKSVFGTLGKIALGGGAIAGITAAAKAISETVTQYAKLQVEASRGTIRQYDLQRSFVAMVPGIGAAVNALDDLIAAFTGVAVAEQKFLERNQRAAAWAAKFDETRENAFTQTKNYEFQAGILEMDTKGIGLAGFAKEEFEIEKTWSVGMRTMGKWGKDLLDKVREANLGVEALEEMSIWVFDSGLKMQRILRERKDAQLEQLGRKRWDAKATRDSEDFRRMYFDDAPGIRVRSQPRMDSLRSLVDILAPNVYGRSVSMPGGYQFGSSDAASAINRSRAAANQSSEEAKLLREANRKLEDMVTAIDTMTRTLGGTF